MQAFDGVDRLVDITLVARPAGWALAYGRTAPDASRAEPVVSAAARGEAFDAGRAVAPAETMLRDLAIAPVAQDGLLVGWTTSDAGDLWNRRRIARAALLAHSRRGAPGPVETVTTGGAGSLHLVAGPRGDRAVALWIGQAGGDGPSGEPYEIRASTRVP